MKENETKRNCLIKASPTDLKDGPCITFQILVLQLSVQFVVRCINKKMEALNSDFVFLVGK